MTTINIIFILVSLVICLLSFFMVRRGNRPLRPNVYTLFLGIAIVLALVVRLARFGAIPGGVNQDGAMAALDAKALALYGTDRLGMIRPVHFTAWGFGQMSVLMSYLMVPFIRLFGLNVITMRLPILIVSLLGLAALYLFCRESFNKDLALIVLFFAAVNPWHIVQSRWALDCNMFPHVLMIALCLLNHGVKTGRHLFTYLSMPVFGLSMYCYGISIYTVPLFLLFSAFCLIVLKKVNLKQFLLCLALYLAVALPFILMILINAFDLKPIETKLFTIPLFPDTVRKADILFFSDSFFPQLWANILSLLRILFQIGDDYLCNVVPGFSTMYVFTIPFMLVGWFWLFRNWRSSTGLFFLRIYFIVAVFGALITNNVNVNRANLLFYPLMIFAGIGIYRVLRNVRFSDIAVEIMFGAGFALFCCFYFTNYAKDISRSFLRDFGSALTSVASDDYSRIYITPDSQDVGRDYVSEVYALYWYDIDSRFYQSDAFDKKYIFRNPDEALIAGNPDAAFVICSDDVDLFRQDEYEITEFGRFASAVPKPE